VARNQQRSLSIIRASKEHETELCSHKVHCRLEQLKNLNFSHNQLTSLDLFIPFDARDEQTVLPANSQNWKDQQVSYKFKWNNIFPFLADCPPNFPCADQLGFVKQSVKMLAQPNLDALTIGRPQFERKQSHGTFARQFGSSRQAVECPSSRLCFQRTAKERG
jgi:hypothetical protein